MDITIECNHPRPRRRYCLEAKRCCHNTHPISWYLEGIPPFLSGQYAADAPEAGLLGLVQGDSPQYWKQRALNELEGQPALACDWVNADIVLTPDLPDMCASRHLRENETRVTLYHAFLDCAPVGEPGRSAV